MADTGATPTTDPSLAQAAQIPLQNFNLPTFPTEASGLRDLTLTADIKLDDYQELLSKQSEPIPELPKSIASLTLELFALGFPEAWLTQLGKQLPNLKALTVFSGLIDGLDDKSRSDAESLFRGLKDIREIHLLDVFCRPGFVKSISQSLDSTKLQFLEVSYTYRGHSDPEFLARVSAEELPLLFKPSLVAASLSLSAPPPPPEGEEKTLEDPSNLDEKGDLIDNRRPEGIMPLQPKHSDVLIEQLVKGPNKPKELMMLDTTLYTLSTAQVSEVLNTHKSLAVFSASVALESDEQWRKKLLASLDSGKNLEMLELVGVPSVAFYDEVSTQTRSLASALEAVFPSAADVESLIQTCPKLSSFRMSILRTSGFGSVEWTKNEAGELKGGIIKPTEQDLPPRPKFNPKNDPWAAEHRERPGGPPVQIQEIP